MEIKQLSTVKNVSKKEMKKEKEILELNQNENTTKQLECVETHPTRKIIYKKRKNTKWLNDVSQTV